MGVEINARPNEFFQTCPRDMFERTQRGDLMILVRSLIQSYLCSSVYVDKEIYAKSMAHVKMETYTDFQAYNYNKSQNGS